MITVPEELTRHVEEHPLDTSFIPRQKLDLAEKTQSSFYPWRGQFSPGLVSLLLEAYAKRRMVVLDPFAGSGTTLFEAARIGLECVGSEINPAAVQLASMVKFVNLNERDRGHILNLAQELFDRHLGAFLPVDLFNDRRQDALEERDLSTTVNHLLREAEEDPLLRSFVVTTLMLAMGNGDTFEAASLRGALSKNRLAVTRMPTTPEPCEVLSSDARNLPLAESVVDLVITSPPYINVFNYHQNYRKAMEMMGWHPLQIAKSEIGSNRKHRGNRFLTVVQYCMDLSQTFTELKRLLVPNGAAVFVVGRESRVRDVPFYNGRLLALVAAGEDSFRLQRWQERRFTNRFGKTIYEDIITLVPEGGAEKTPSTEFGRGVGAKALTDALNLATGTPREDIQQALQRIDAIEPSPISPNTPKLPLLPR